VEGRRYQDRIYVLIFDLDLEAYQQRAAQIQIIDTGFEIAGLEEANLSGMEPLPLTAEIVAELEAFIEEQMVALEVPGMAIAVVRDGEIAYAEGFGVRDLETEEAVTPETLMMIGSTTKPLTTMLMARMVDQGLFEWDTPAVEILPTFEVTDPDLTGALTMRNLVCACTGVPRRDFELLFNASEMDAADVIESVSEFEFFTDFGEAFQYSNQMVATGGYLATLAAGGDLETLLPDYMALLQTELLDPMEMSASTFDFEAVAASDNYAQPYGQTPLAEMVELPLSTEALLLPIAPAGALWSNVLDMANFARTNLNQGVAPDGTRVVSAENLAVTWEPQIDISADASYGLGWILEDYKGLQILSHAGNTSGFTSELAFVPEAELGVSILTNQQGSALNQIVRTRLLELLYEQESEVGELVAFSMEQGEEARQELEEALVDVEVDSIAPYLGAYESESLGSLSLAWEEDTLLMDAGEFRAEVRARQTEEGEIEYLIFTPPFAGLPLELAESEAGTPTISLGAGLVEYTFEKVE
jgi:CubicO group peptidase (beta-lactamase class C family)